MKTRIALWCLCSGITAGSTLGVPPTIHVAWGEPNPPVLDFHYFISTDPPASPDFPDVELKGGSLTWQIWSTDTDNPDDIGDIGIITSPAPENFVVTIEDDLGNPGARHVKGIILDPTDAANQSGISGGRITGDLTGDLLVQEDSNGTGGQVTFAIGGAATGTMTIPRVSMLTIDDQSGLLQIDEVLPGAPFYALAIVQVTGTTNIGVAKGNVILHNVSGSVTIDSIEADPDNLLPPTRLDVSSALPSTGSLTIGEGMTPTGWVARRTLPLLRI